MRIKDLTSELDEAKLNRGKRYSNTRNVTAVDPATYNTIRDIEKLDREKAAIKAAKKAADKANAPPSNMPPPRQVLIGGTSFSIPEHDVQKWRDTHDTEWALDRAMSWGTSNMPGEFKVALRKDPDWQKTVLGIWDAAELTLTAMAIGPRFSRTGARSEIGYLDRLDGIDPRKVYAKHRELVFDLKTIIKLYHKRFGIDKTGRRIPG